LACHPKAWLRACHPWHPATLLSAICCAAASADPVAFKTIDRGGQSNIENAREVVGRTAAEWTPLWKQHTPDRPRPAVDFTRSPVVGVFLRSRPTGGYDVEITSIDRDGANLVVTYRERRPDPADIVTQVITMPYDVERTSFVYASTHSLVASNSRFSRSP
jgi:hypothetical protein